MAIRCAGNYQCFRDHADVELPLRHILPPRYQTLQPPLSLGLSRAHLTSVFSPPWIRLCAWMRKESLQEVLVETEVEWTTDIHGFIYNCLYGFLGLNVSLPASLLQKGLQLCVVMALPLANIDAHMSDLWLWRRIFWWSTTVFCFSAGSDYVRSCWLAYIYFCIWHFWLADVVMLSKETQYLRWCLRQTFVVLLPVPCLSRRWRGWMQTYVCNARMIMVAYVIVAGLLYQRFARCFLCYFLPWCTTECFLYMHKWPGLIIMNPMYS